MLLSEALVQCDISCDAKQASNLRRQLSCVQDLTIKQQMHA